MTERNRQLFPVHACQAFHTVNSPGYPAFENNPDAVLTGIIVPGVRILLIEFPVGGPVFSDNHFIGYKHGFLVEPERLGFGLGEDVLPVHRVFPGNFINFAVLFIRVQGTGESVLVNLYSDTQAHRSSQSAVQQQRIVVFKTYTTRGKKIKMYILWRLYEFTIPV